MNTEKQNERKAHTMGRPRIADTVPFPVRLNKGDTVYWCACGLSQTQPYCDGSHKGTSFSPVPYTAERDKIVFFCGCKHSSKGMVCDGSHVKLKKKKQNT